MKRESMIIFAVILIFASCAWLLDDQLQQTDVTIYQLYCAGTQTGPKCVGREKTVPPSTYRASSARQDVIFWENSDESPKKYTDCTVRDARNWSCGVPGYSPNEFQMKGGDLHRVWDHDGAVMMELLYAVPKWRWWLTRLAEMTHSD